jgi:hypothetical protein
MVALQDGYDQLPERKYGVLGLDYHQRTVLSAFMSELEDGLEIMKYQPDMLLPIVNYIRRFDAAETLSEKVAVLDSMFHYFEEYVMRFSHKFHMIVADLKSRVSMDEHMINPDEMTMEQFVKLLNFYLGYSEKGGEVEEEDEDDFEA